MKFVNQLDNNNLDTKEMNQEQHETNDNMLVEEDYEEDDGDEVDDNEDFQDEHKYFSNNHVEKATVQVQPAVKRNNKIFLPKNTAKKFSSTQNLVDEAITQLNERGGSSVPAIFKFIMSNNPQLTEKRLKTQIKRYLKNCTTDGTMVQIKRSFKLTNKHRMKNKQLDKPKLKANEENQNKKEKLVKEKKKKQKNPKKEKLPKIEKSSEKLKNKTKTAKVPLKEKNDAKSKPDTTTKWDKIGKSSQTTDIKNKDKSKSKGKKPRRSITLVLRPTPPHSKPKKHVRVTAKELKKENRIAVAENIPLTTASGAVKATGRGKKKLMNIKKVHL